MLAGIAFLAALVINNLLAEQIVSLGRHATQKKTSKVSKRTDPRAGEWAELIVDRNIFNSEPPAPSRMSPTVAQEAMAERNGTPMPSQRVSMIARERAPVRLSAASGRTG